MYTIKKDAAKKRININLVGWFTIEEAESYTRELRQAIDFFNNQKQPFTLLADLSEFKTSTKEVADQLSTVQEYARESGLAKSATIVPAEIVGAMQVKRYAKQTKIDHLQQYFTTIEEAEQYLD